MVLTEKKPWYRQKTTWTGILAIVGAVGGYLTDTLTPLIMLLVVSLLRPLIRTRCGLSEYIRAYPKYNKPQNKLLHYP